MKPIRLAEAKPPSVKAPNNVFVTSDGHGLEVLSERNVDGDNVYECRKYDKTTSLFDSPLDSRMISCFIVDNVDTSLIQLKANDLKRKAIKIDLNQKVVFMGLLHNAAESSA